MRNATPAYRRHDISDETWALLEPHVPGRHGVWGGVAQDNRLLVLKTGSDLVLCIQDSCGFMMQKDSGFRSHSLSLERGLGVRYS